MLGESCSWLLAANGREFGLCRANGSAAFNAILSHAGHYPMTLSKLESRLPLDDSAPRCTVAPAQILGALSYALDLTEGQPPGHCLRSCWIGAHIGRALTLDQVSLTELHYAILLKDLGCSSNAARIAQLFATDDLGFKHDAKLLGDSAAPAMRFILRHTNRGAGVLERIRSTIHVCRNAGPIVQDLIETRCERGASIAQQLRFGPPVAEAIRCLDERWDGGGRPAGLRGDAIPLYARIALLAQVADVFHRADGPEAACAEVRARRGTWFDPAVVSAFLGVARDSAFWAMLSAPPPVLEAAVLALMPTVDASLADDDYLDDIATAFAQVVDAKSPFTQGHSARVARFTDRIALHMGLEPSERRRLVRAALLHDVGKLGVSNAILDKPGKLDDVEWTAMRQHSAHSETILSRIPAFAELASIGGAHHERLDGKGYPRGIDAAAISLPTRIVSAADVCDALTADRPYRPAMPPDRMLSIMREDVGTAFDPACFEALSTLTQAGEMSAEPG